MNTDAMPGVQVTQTAVSPGASLGAAQLNATFVTPLYRVVENAIVFANGVFPAVTTLTPLTIDYPVIDPGAIVDLSSVDITLKNALIKWLTVNSGALAIDGVGGFVAGSQTFSDANTDFIAAGVKAGDVVVVGDGTSALGQYVVADGGIAQHTLTFTYPVYMTFTSSDTGYFITRLLSSWILSNSYFTATVDNVSISSLAIGSQDFISGEIDISYRVLRTDKSGLVTYQNIDEVLADMEVDSIQNKIGFYIEQGIIPANGNTTQFQVFFLQADTQTAYLEALDQLSLSDNSYMLVPLTDDEVVINAYATNVELVSEPSEGMFRILLGTTTLSTQTVLTNGSAALYYI